MTIAVIEINDPDLRLSQAGELLARQPGYAMIEADRLLLGEAARREARIHPLQTNNQFWRQLNLEEIPSPHPKVRHHADLAHLQLTQLCENQSLTEVIFAVPGSFSGEQLSLLLGIAQQSPFTTVGVVDSAIAAAAQCAPRGRFAVLDMQLHQTVITEVEVTDTAARRKFDTVANVGLLACYESLAKRVADQFIRHTRFNPRHDANTEQSLFDQLPDWLANCHPERDYEFELEGKSVQLSRAMLLDSIKPLYDQLQRRVLGVSDTLDGVLLTPTAGALPGLAESWPATHVIDAGAVALACHHLAPQLRGGANAISFTTELPATTKPVTLQRHTPANRTTHLLYQHCAYPLTQGKLYISGGDQPVFSPSLTADSLCAVEELGGELRLKALNGSTPYVNDQPGADDTPLRVGDRLQLQGDKAVITIINVLSDTG